jgi:hypothetical protein
MLPEIIPQTGEVAPFTSTEYVCHDCGAFGGADEVLME